MSDKWAISEGWESPLEFIQFPGEITYTEKRPRSVFVTCRVRGRVLAYEITKRRNHLQKRFLHSWPIPVVPPSREE